MSVLNNLKMLLTAAHPLDVPQPAFPNGRAVRLWVQESYDIHWSETIDALKYILIHGNWNQQYMAMFCARFVGLKCWFEWSAQEDRETEPDMVAFNGEMFVVEPLDEPWTQYKVLVDQTTGKFYVPEDESI